MALFTGIGDFFRGAFGEDAEEKKRRKQREAQEAAARKQQASKQRQQNDPSNKPNGQVVVTKPKILAPRTVPTLQQTPVVAPEVPKAAPRPTTPAPLPDQDFLGATAKVKGKNILGDKVIETKVDTQVKTNTDKYVAQFDKLKPEVRRAIIKTAEEKASKGDKTALNTLKALQDTGRTRLSGTEKLQRAADYAAAPGASVTRVAAGAAQGISGLYDLFTPGKGTNRVSKQLDRGAKNLDTYAKETDVEAAYKTGNVVGEVASYLIPSTAATKIASKFPKATKITSNVVEKAASLADNAGDAGKIRQALANGMRKGLTLDEILEETAINSKYIGENASKGNETTPLSVATDMVTGFAGNTAFRGVGSLFGRSRRAAEEGVDVLGREARIAQRAEQSAAEETEKEIAALQAWNQENVDRQLRGEAPLPRPGEPTPQDIYKQEQSSVRGEGKTEREMQDMGLNPGEDVPAYAKQGETLPSEADAIKKLAETNAALQRLKEFNLKQKLADAIKRYPQYKDELIRGFSSAKFNDNFDDIPEATELLVRKKALEDVVNRSNSLKQQGADAVAKQADETDEAVKAGQDAVADAQAAQAAQTAPVSGAAADVPAGSPEVKANNAYQSDMDYATASTAVVDAIGENKGEIKRGNVLYNNPLSRFFNKTQQAYIEAVDKGREGVSDIIQKGIQSGNTVTRGAAEAPRMFFKNFGQSEPVRNVLIKRTSQLQNSGRVAKVALDKMEAAVKQAGDPATVYQKIYRVLEDPEFLERVFGDGTKLSIDDLNPAERNALDQLVKLNKIRNDINLKVGIIDPELHAKYADGMHSPRIYDINVEHPELAGFVGSSRYLDLKSGIKRKDVKDVPDYVLSQLVDSPFQASALRLEGALKNLANSETLTNLDNLGGLPASPPNKNFVQLTGKKYGAHEGKYIDKQLLSQIDGKDYYNSQLGQQIGDGINTFHNSALGAPGRALKKFRTTLSPGTFIGNVGSGQVAFSGASNINPITSMVRTVQAAKQLNANGINPQVQEAELAGLFAGDTGRQITNSKAPDSAIRKGKDNVWDKANNVYGGVDKASALGWYNEFRARGLTPEQAVARVHLGMQNYGNAGRTVNALSDSPIFGKPFARFTPELIRIFKNAAIYNPVGTAAKGAGLYAGANYMSDRAGETPEERKAREEAPGQTKINLPGDNDLSLNIPVGDSSVNIARAIGLNFPQEPNGDPNTAILRQLNPLADMTRTNAQGDEVIAPNQAFGDMFYRAIADQVADRDFMGREITDPKNKTYYEDGDASIKKYEGKPSDSERLENRTRAGAQNLPFAPEVDSILSGISNNEDFYGKKRSVPQAIARMLGVKVENNDQETRDKRADANLFFDEDMPAVQQFVRDNPDLAQKYYQIKNPTRTRPTDENDPGTKVSDVISPERWDIINSDTSGRLFNFMKSQDERLYNRSVEENKLDPNKKIKPVDPVYQLPPDQAKYVAELRSRPSGDDIEAQEILRATSGWYKDYEDRYHDYLTQNSEYYDSLPEFQGAAKENPRVKEYGQVSPPVEQPEIVKQYYQVKNQNADAAKDFFKANKDKLSAAFDDYAKARLDRINKLRKIEGNYEPISLETFTNKTFGFDVDDDKSGFGWGGGGGGRKGVPDVNTLTELTNFGDGVKRFNPIEAEEMPNMVAAFQKLMAGGKSGKPKPKIGASARGQ